MERMAEKAYKTAAADFEKFCREKAEMTAGVDEGYPFSVTVVRESQIGLTGEIEGGTVRVIVGLNTAVQCEDKRLIDADILKKLIKRAEALGRLYYIWYRESMVEE